MSEGGDSGKEGKEKRLGSYVLGKTLGQGAFSKVKLGWHEKTGEKVAIKTIHKYLITDIEDIERVNREVHVLKRINHPNIIRILEVIEDQSEMSIIMEHASGGELFDRIVEFGKLDEDESRRIFNQICSAVEYCHRQKIVHRDLKPENILFDSNNNVKLVDFGLSNTIRHGFLLKTMCGSPAYAPPEMVDGEEYDGPPVDVWSLGVILYFMVTGKHPFEADDQISLFKKIKTGKYTIKKHVSQECADLISKMLTVDPFKRAHLSYVRHHDWFNMGGAASLVAGSSRVSPRGDSKTNSPTTGDGESLFNKMDFFDRIRSPPSPPPGILDEKRIAERPATHHENLPEVRGGKEKGMRKPPSAVAGGTRDASSPNRAFKPVAKAGSRGDATKGGNAQRSRAPSVAAPGGGQSPATRSRLAVPKKKREDLSSPHTASPSGGHQFRRLPSKGLDGASGSGGASTNNSPSGAAAASGAGISRRASRGTVQTQPSEEKMKHRPAGSSILLSTTRAPRDIVREIQKAFSALHIMFKQQSSLTIRGEAVTSQSRVTLELEITAAGSSGGSESVLRSKKLSGDQAEYKDLCARVLSEMDI